MMTSKPDDVNPIKDTWDVRTIIGALPLKTDVSNLSFDEDYDNVTEKLNEFSQIYNNYRALKNDFNLSFANIEAAKIALAKNVQKLWNEMNRISEHLGEQSPCQSEEVKKLLRILAKDESAHDKIKVQ